MFSWLEQLMEKGSHSNYEQRFNKALERTTAWGLAAVEFSRSPSNLASDDNCRIFQEVATSVLSPLCAEDVSQQCFAITAALKTPLENALQVPLIYTLGYVEYHKHKVFHSDVLQLKEMLDHGIASPALDLHAWLTLPSHEIIDVTFGTTYGVVTQTPELIGRMCFLHPDDMPDDLQYHPQLIGEDYLVRIGGTCSFLVLS